MTHWTDAGFGTDPEGDAARRAELETARADPLRAITAAITAAADARHRTSGGLLPEEVHEELYADGHAVTRTDYGSSVAIVCACGRWECIVTGPSSAAWAGRDYRRHVDDETRARDA